MSPISEPLPTVSEIFRELVAAYESLLRGYVELASIGAVLISRHELANVLLLLRAVVNQLPAERWQESWRPLGRLGAISREAAANCSTASDVAELLKPTLFAPLRHTVAATTSGSLGSTTLAAERQLAAALLAAMDASTRTDAARQLLALLVLEHGTGCGGRRKWG